MKNIHERFTDYGNKDPNAIVEFISAVLEQEIFEASKIQELKRPNALSMDKLGLKASGGVENIKAVYNQATPEEREYWGKWYHNAKTDVEELAALFNLPFPVMAAIVAVLSPGNKWNSNLLAAEKLLKGDIKINAYPRQAARALQILKTGDTKLVTGPKVTVFYKSLMDPASVEKDMVLDGHAINIWRGEKSALKGLRNPSAKERAQMVADYQKAAKELGVPVQAVQATTWYIWKYTGKGSPVETPKGKFDTSQFTGQIPANDNATAELATIQIPVNKTSLTESSDKQYKFLGQCDKLRRNCKEKEDFWQKMMAKAKEISFEQFVKLADMRALLDEDETPYQYLADLKNSDPTTKTFISEWGQNPCVFLQTGGFEFIFVYNSFFEFNAVGTGSITGFGLPLGAKPKIIQENVEWLPRNEIIPPHEIKNDDKVVELAKKMKIYGWQGRPVLVEPAYSEGKAWAWTGTHRLAAAKLAGIDEIPVVYIDIEKLEDSGYQRDKYGYFAGKFKDDEDREKVLHDVEDFPAWQLMDLEIKKNLEEF